MLKLLIVEGPDDVGKTTLLKKIKHSTTFHKWSIDYYHDTAPICSGLDGHREQLAKLEDRMKDLRHKSEKYATKNSLQLYDRSGIGECVYGPRFRRYDISDKYWVRLDQFLITDNWDSMVVVLYADQQTYKKWNITSKDDDHAYQKQKNAKDISRRFVNVVTKHPARRVLLVNCNNYETIDERNEYVIAHVVAWLQDQVVPHKSAGNYAHSFYNHQQRFWSVDGFLPLERYNCPAEPTCSLFHEHITLAPFGVEYRQPTNGYGNIHPEWIFIGEAPGYNGCGKLGLPFYDDVSGNLFQTMLDTLKILPTQIYVTNVVKCCPKDNKLGVYKNFENQRQLHCVGLHLKREIGDLLRRHEYAKVVAVGRTAETVLTKLGIRTYAMIKHPAYFCRVGMQKQYPSYCANILFKESV